MENNLPKGWVWFDMLDVIDYEGGSQPPKKVFTYEPRKGYVRLVQIRDYGNKPFPTYIPDSTRLKKAEKDDLLIARYGGSSANDSLGRICSGIKGAYNVALAKVIFPKKFLDTSFVRYLLSGPWFKDRLNSLSRSCQTGFNREDLKELYFPLPPLAEQRRLVEKLDVILQKLEDNKQRLEKIPQLLKRFRQSALLSAYSGELTKNWRKENSSKLNASEALEGVISTGTQRKRSTSINEEFIQLEIPDSWTKTNIDILSDSIVDCPHSTPKWSDTGKICLRTSNFLPNKLNLSEIKYVSKKVFEDRISRLKPLKGDILYSREGGILGVACILDLDEEVCLGQRMMLFRLNSNVEAKFICYFLNSPLILKHVNSLIGGSAAPHINVGDIKEFPIPFPSFEEQKKIVQLLEKLFLFADKIEARYLKAKHMLDKLSQSILAKAFRGELVLQNPNDEPASILLEKIKLEKTTQIKKNSTKRRKALNL